MGSQLFLDVGSVRSAVAQLDAAARSIFNASSPSLLTSLAAFSPVSGLDMAGRMHGTVAGTYEPMSSKAFASHIRDAAVLLESNLNNTVRADADFSRLVSHIGVVKGAVARAASRAQAAAPAPALVNAKTGRFANAAPVAGPQFSLPGLHSLLSATNPAEAATASGQWGATAARLGETVAALEGAKAALTSSAATSWVQAALGHINRIQWAGGTYAAHATAMASHTANLASVAAAKQVLTAAAYATWAALPSPEQKIAFEQAYLAPFPSTLTASLVPTKPVFNQLLPDLADMPGDHFNPGAVSVAAAPEFDKIGLPTIVADAFRQRGYGDLAQARTPDEVVSQFSAITPEVVEAISAGATPMQAAALAAPSMPATLTPGASLGAGGAAPGAGASGMGMGVPLPGGLLGAQSSPRPGSAAGTSIVPGLGVGGGAGHHRATGRPQLGGAGHAGGSGRPQFGGVGAGTVGLPADGANRSSITGAPTAAQAGPRAAPVSGVAGPAGPGGPMGPAGGVPRRGSEDTRRGARVKAVTSAVERDGNLRALLGQAPAVLPGVIGFNVTQPQR
ncbi:hypothetical protein CAURIS_03910 [Corynebacterium auris]|nr:hypothetical protein CAURIS_03910 [Corynebacterium auris]